MNDLTAVWGQGLEKEMNLTLAFVLDMGSEKRGKISLSAASCFKILADGVTLGFGPNRAAHGYARISEFSFNCRYITVEVHSHYVLSFCWIKQEPFFACSVETTDGFNYCATDFKCYRLSDRLQKVQRYSFQRGFSEIYRIKRDRRKLYLGESDFEEVKTEKVELPKLLKSFTENPKLTPHDPARIIGEGSVLRDESKPLWEIGGIHSGVDGYSVQEWEESATDDASQFVYCPCQDGKKLYNYKLLDFSRAITGFFELNINAIGEGKVYILFDEILSESGMIDFRRIKTSNVMKWNILNEGKFSVSSFEPYTARYICVVYSDGIDCSVRIRDFENPEAEKFDFKCSDERVNTLMRAAKATFAQNSVDVLTDCPSRERGGYVSDSWFTSVSERIFTGDNKAERTLLENYILADCSKVPKGQVPMCYPADIYVENIPNWSLWYVMEIVKYADVYGFDDIVKRSENNVKGIIEYFQKKENEFGALEDLDGWVFVEWSAANDRSHVCGVNVPSNVCYAECLDRAGKLYGYADWVERADRIRRFIKENAFDGRFFVDNLIRNEDGKLVRTKNYTEVCQYYAFWFNCINKNEYEDLYNELIENLGINRKEGEYSWLGKPNAMYGIYMRIDLLMRYGERKKVLDECVRYFLPMAESTGTLWEAYDDFHASCVHGFASYVARWLLFAMEG